MERLLITKMKILSSATNVYEAFADPKKIGNFWFSTSSTRWQPNTDITLEYIEYNAQVEIKIAEMQKDKEIIFNWGENDFERTVTISIDEIEKSCSIVTITESGWIEDEKLTQNLVGNKEGWVYMLTCLKGYLENGVNTLRTGIVM